MSEKICIVVCEEYQNNQELKYILDLLPRYLGFQPVFFREPEKSMPCLQYGGSFENKEVVKIRPSGFFREKCYTGNGIKQKAEIFCLPDGEKCFIPADAVSGIPFLSMNYKSAETSLDIFAAAFMLLSGMLSFFNPDSCDFPPVDRYLHILRMMFESTFPQIRTESLFRKPVMFLSHDIDVLKKFSSGYLPFRILGNLSRRDFIQIQQDISEFIRHQKGCDPYSSFHEMVLFEKEYGHRSTWFFMSAGYNPLKKQYYRLCDACNIISYLNRMQLEIGLHGSFDACHDYQALEKERQALESVSGQKVHGIRNHWLRFDLLHTWMIQSEKFSYDSTFAFSSIPGYRSGFSLPFPVYIRGRKNGQKLWEIPLCVMDGTLVEHMKFSPEKAGDKMSSIISQTGRCNGVFGLLWHNSSLFDCRYRPYLPVYLEALQKTSDFQSLTGSEIAQISEKKLFANLSCENYNSF